MDTLLPFSTSIQLRSRGYLPHWKTDDAIDFITYRLADSLPAAVLEELAREHANLVRLIGEETATQRTLVQTRYLGRLNAYLDAGHGDCHLRNREIAQCVTDTWQHFDRDRYHLIAWCVMPNHVHVMIRLFHGKDLWRTVHSWKSYTANFANRVLDRQGPFWFRDYYDRCIRSERELARTIDYVFGNPAPDRLERLAFCGVRRLVAGGPAGW